MILFPAYFPKINIYVLLTCIYTICVVIPALTNSVNMFQILPVLSMAYSVLEVTWIPADSEPLWCWHSCTPDIQHFKNHERFV